jgi:hypothetical protein
MIYSCECLKLTTAYKDCNRYDQLIDIVYALLLFYVLYTGGNEGSGNYQYSTEPLYYS